MLNLPLPQMDKIDSAYYAHSTRLNLDDETRVNATNVEAEQWRKQNEATTGTSADLSLPPDLTLPAMRQNPRTSSQKCST